MLAAAMAIAVAVEMQVAGLVLHVLQEACGDEIRTSATHRHADSTGGTAAKGLVWDMPGCLHRKACS